ncbi:MAG: ACT domain-containing protein [Planctomycetota bacterium]|jgi:hypothetical protein
MKITQISVFLENRKGRLSEVCSMLGQADVNIRALTIAETESFGVLRMVVDKPSEAADLFRKNGITANLTDVVAAEVPDKPGGLAAVLKTLSDHDVNVEYMYGFVEKNSENALLVFRFAGERSESDRRKRYSGPIAAPGIF